MNNKDQAYQSTLDKMRPFEGSRVYRLDKNSDKFRQRFQQALRLHNQLENLNGERMPNKLKNVHQRMKAYQEVAFAFRDYAMTATQLQTAALGESTQLKEGMNQRAGKRWTDEEDTALIELAASGHDVQQIGLALSRSPGAVSSRISHLVGIKRISVEFAGTIKGQLNGQEVEGTFVGEVRKAS